MRHAGRCVGGPRDGFYPWVSDERTQVLRLIKEPTRAVSPDALPPVTFECEAVLYCRDYFGINGREFMFWRWSEISSEQAVDQIRREKDAVDKARRQRLSVRAGLHP